MNIPLYEYVSLAPRDIEVCNVLIALRRPVCVYCPRLRPISARQTLSARLSRVAAPKLTKEEFRYKRNVGERTASLSR